MHGTAIALPFLHALQLHMARKHRGDGLIDPRARSFWNPDEVGPDWPIFHVAPATAEEEAAIEGSGLQDAAMDMAQALLPHLPDHMRAVGTPALEALKLVLGSHKEGDGAKYGGGWMSSAWDSIKTGAREIQHNDLVHAIEKRAVGAVQTAGTKALQGAADAALAETGVGEVLAPLANRAIAAGTSRLAGMADSAIDGSGYFRPGEGYYRPGEGDASHLRPSSHNHLDNVAGHTRPFRFRRVA